MTFPSNLLEQMQTEYANHKNAQATLNEVWFEVAMQRAAMDARVKGHTCAMTCYPLEGHTNTPERVFVWDGVTVYGHPVSFQEFIRAHKQLALADLLPAVAPVREPVPSSGG